MITVTSLVNPVMIAKIRQGLHHAIKCEGHKMGGHGNRVYIQNRKGHNILRIDWKGQGKYIAYGGADWGQTDVTEIVKEALQRGCSSNRIKPRLLTCTDGYKATHPTTEKNVQMARAFIESNPDLKARLAQLAKLAGIGASKMAIIGLCLSNLSGGFI
ncbi:hypothetical protein psageK4_174 [Pseudomonas phage psageK4]|uniref:Uncharacterized protein n=1 Tax=Pseudomonas phage psageK4 TaxID=2859563 RepID=A0ABX8STT4_9CAUD|nr:hypothetical protein QGX14_gp061 [Pseudomonas phage psageK4]QXV71828.1 hypothetical protein psageK4_174 [Pseudomonas phage psageK4]